MASDLNVVDIYPLAPMQRLYLAVSGLDREVTVVQLRYAIVGDLDIRALESSWRYLVSRHSILRTGFVSQDIDEPLQVVFASPPLNFQVEDVTNLEEELQKRRIDESCAADRAQAFDLERPPLTRLRLFRTGPSNHLMVWSYHRILLDGWSLNLMMQELSAAYRACAAGSEPDLTPASPYRDFIAWLDNRDVEADLEYWRRILAGYRRPAMLPSRQQAQIDGPRTYRRHVAKFSAPATAALQRIAKAHGLTPNTMVQCAWAVVLSGYTGLRDVVFGYAVAGRPADLSGVEGIAGLFTNNLPMRMHIKPEESALALLKRVQAQQIDMSSYEQTPFTEIRKAADMPIHQRLFETLVVYQSHAGGAAWRFGESLQMIDQNDPLANNYPATLVAVPGKTLKLVLAVDANVVSGELAAAVVNDVATLLEKMSATVACPVSELLDAVQRAPEPEQSVQNLPARSLVAARDILELRVIGIFQQAFGRTDIGAADSFFALGGHSLLAVWLFQPIEQAFDKKLPLATLLHASTPEALATVLREENWSPSWSSLVPINAGGSRLPLFCIHGGGGNVLFYRELAARLGPDQPFFALQPQGMDGKLPTHTTVEEMAAHYIHEMRQLQPQGPYRIGGASFGGMVAFEMARLLREQGHEVGLVALFDTHGPGYPEFRPGITRWHKTFFRHQERLDYHARNLLLLDNRGRIEYLGQKLAKAKHMLRLGMKRSRKRVARRWRELLGTPLPTDLVRTQNAILHALQTYKPAFYDGEITVFRATRQPKGVVPNRTLGWESHAKVVTVVDVPGYHTGIILEPHVRFMADKLQRALSQEAGRTEAPSSAAPGRKLAGVAVA